MHKGFYNETEDHGYTTVSFMEGEELPQPVSSFSSICIAFCVVVHAMEQACPQKSGVSLSAQE
jgi:hypothetical protein